MLFLWYITVDNSIKNVLILQLNYLLISFCRSEFIILDKKCFNFHVVSTLVLSICLSMKQNYITFNVTRLTVL